MNRVNRAISPRNVVSALAARKSHVPLRDSKLTRSQSMPNKPNEPNDWAFHLCFLGPSALKFAEFVASPGSWTVLLVATAALLCWSAWTQPLSMSWPSELRKLLGSVLHNVPRFRLEKLWTPWSLHLEPCVWRQRIRLLFCLDMSGWITVE